ncbi:MAG TPA: hypothetical protein PKC76_03960 [Saprospiraceae bacterium]|nr:hypothetical protein [Saprospiraceae bacterium]HMP23257.1 hypothetical protein [Saprospiraceae bacterium]
MKRKIFSHSEAKVILSPYYERIAKAVLDGFGDYLKIANCSVENVGFVEYEPRTKACIVHEHIKNRVQEAFQGMTEIEARKWNGVFGLKINEDLFIRFNKINDDYSSRGYMTKQAKCYKNQMIIDGFPDEPTFLVAGYSPDASWTQIKGIYITCWDGENLQWVEEIISHKSSIQTTIPFANTEQETQKRIKLKTDKKPDTKIGIND